SNVGWIEEDDWILYDIPMAAGEYSFSYRVASYGGDERFHLQSGNGQETYSTVAFGSTGDWQSWITVETVVQLDSSIESFRLSAVGRNWNINWLEITPLSPSSSSSSSQSSSSSSHSSSSSTESSSSSTHSSSSSTTSSSSSESSSSIGSDVLLRIEAEDYHEMSGIQLEATQDVGGGQNVGWIEADDWMSYHINFPEAGEYKVRFRVAGHG